LLLEVAMSWKDDLDREAEWIEDELCNAAVDDEDRRRELRHDLADLRQEYRELEDAERRLHDYDEGW